VPDLDELAGFEPGTPTRMLPPSEVRRRGERRRRTTTLVAAGAALAAAVAIGTPVALLSGGGGGGRDIQPAPDVPTTTADPTTAWVTSVPGDFPLASGFPAADAEPRRGLANDASLVPRCGSEGFTGFVDDRVVTYTGESSEDHATRALALYPDDAAARRQLAELRDAVTGCAPQPIAQGTTAVYGTVPVDLGTDESFAFTQQVRHDGDDLLSELTFVQVGRTGNALFVDTSYGAAGGDQVVTGQAALMMERATVPLQSMCLFAANPCTISTGSGSEPAPDPTDDVPDDFPLGVGLETGGDETITGPSPGIDGVSFADVCRTDAWPGAGGTDRLAVRLEGIEFVVTRELVTYATAEQASAVVTALSDAVAACPRDGDRLFETLDADTGYPSSVTFGFTYREGLGGTRFQVVRVGRAVLATAESDEFGPDSLAAGVAALTADNREITDLMRCSWTEDGC
jgi:hypothetical protein